MLYHYCLQTTKRLQAYLIIDPQVAKFNEKNHILELTQISGISSSYSNLKTKKEQTCMCNYWRAISANQSPRVLHPESLLFPFDVQRMYAVCVGRLWERPRLGILSRVSDFKGRWMRTTHLCVNCEFLFICVANVETKFKHRLVWGPSRGHILTKHFASHLLSAVRVCDSQFCIFTDILQTLATNSQDHTPLLKSTK